MNREQQAIDLLTGAYVPKLGSTPIWDCNPEPQYRRTGHSQEYLSRTNSVSQSDIDIDACYAVRGEHCPCQVTFKDPADRYSDDENAYDRYLCHLQTVEDTKKQLATSSTSRYEKDASWLSSLMW